MTEDQVRFLLQRRARSFAINRGSSGIRGWCEAKGVAYPHVSEFMNGKRSAATDLLNALNLEYRIMRRRSR